MSKILVIDDSDLVSKLLVEFLSAHNFEVAVAADANQGYSKALEFRPDLILLDVQLPDVMGFELCGVLRNREELRNTPIIMITGSHHATEYKVKGFQKGADDYVLKPFEMPELLERIKALLRRSQARPSEPRPASQEVPRPSSNPEIHFEPRFESRPASSRAPARLDSIPAQRTATSKPAMSLQSAVTTLLLSPLDFSPSDSYPRAATAYLIATLGLIFFALAFAAGTGLKPAIVLLGVGSIWGLLVSVLVMSCSVMGISLRWREGARMLSLAGVPWLIKMSGALVLSAWTTLSPFYYSAGPALFMTQPPPWLERLDLFDLWAAGLLWVLLSKRPGASQKKAWIATGLVWFTAVALTVAMKAMAGGTP